MPLSPGNRTVGIALRAAHLLAMAVFAGGTFLAPGHPDLGAWRAAAALTGLGLLATELTHGGHWLVQVRGLATLAHVAALGLIALGFGRTACALAVLVGAAGSHAPKAVRKWSVRHGRTVD